MKEAPLISVIVPAYNVESYIEKCIDSILRQTYKRIEVIVVDDGSTDATAEICDRYAGLDTRVKVCHKSNGGLVSARKAGLACASGEYVGFVDGDDYVESDMYKKLLENIIETGADFVHSGYIENSGEVTKVVITASKQIIDLHDKSANLTFFADSFLSKKQGNYIVPSVCTKFFKKDFIVACYEKVPNEQQYGEDLLCMCHGILRAKKISIMSDAFYHYVIRNQSIVHRGNKERYIKEVSLSYFILKVIEEYGYMRELGDVLYVHLKKRLQTFSEEDEQMGLQIPKFYFGDMEILRNQSIVLYGAGRVGKDYYAQICKYRDCKIVAWVDKNWNKIELDYTKLQSLSSIEHAVYDVALIAIENEELAKTIKADLISNGIPEEKIVWKSPVLY